MLRDCGLSSWLDRRENLQLLTRQLPSCSLSNSLKTVQRTIICNFVCALLCLAMKWESVPCQFLLERWPTLPTTDNRRPIDWLAMASPLMVTSSTSKMGPVSVWESSAPICTTVHLYVCIIPTIRQTFLLIKTPRLDSMATRAQCLSTVPKQMDIRWDRE